MIKNNVIIDKEIGNIKFDDLLVSDTFIVKDSDCAWIGMKCADIDGVPYILDLSDQIGTVFDDVYEYKIIELIDLKLERA